MKVKLLDTDFLIELLLGKPGALKKAEELDEKHGVATTIMNVLELYKVIETLFQGHNFDALDKIRSFLSHLKILNIEQEMFYYFTIDTLGLSLDELPSQTLVRNLILQIANRNGIKTIISRRPWLYQKLTVEEY
jgi:hypothetical protein